MLGAVDQSTTLASFNQCVYIRVRRTLLQPASTPAATNQPTSTTSRPSAHLYLIEGTIQDIRRYAGTTMDWVIKVAHLICSPLRQGRIYTHTTGTPHEWYHRDKGPYWRQVVQDDQLVPGIYEFEVDFPIGLSRLNERLFHSITSMGDKSSALTFRQQIEIREDGRCAVTRLRQQLVASHLIPKRMGTEGVKSVVADFVGAQEAHYAHKFYGAFVVTGARVSA